MGARYKISMKDLKTILIVILALIVVFQSQCDRKPVEKEIVYKDSITYVPKLDTVKVEKEIIKYVNRYLRDTVVKELTHKDTIYIVNDWSTFKFSSDTLNLDQIGKIIINDTIAFNRIYHRQVIRDFTIVQYLPNKPDRVRNKQLFLGFGVMGSQRQIEVLTGDILLTTKRHGFNVGFGINHDFEYIYKLGMYWKL